MSIKLSSTVPYKTILSIFLLSCFRVDHNGICNWLFDKIRNKREHESLFDYIPKITGLRDYEKINVDAFNQKMDKARILDNVNGHQKIRDSGRNSNRRQEMQPELSVIGNMVLVVRFTKHQSGIIQDKFLAQPKFPLALFLALWSQTGSDFY